MRNEKKKRARRDERGKVNPSSSRIWIWVGDPNSSLLSSSSSPSQDSSFASLSLIFVLFGCSPGRYLGDHGNKPPPTISLSRNTLGRKGIWEGGGDYGGRRKGGRDDIQSAMRDAKRIKGVRWGAESIVIWEMSGVKTLSRWGDGDRISFRPVSGALIREHTRTNGSHFPLSMCSHFPLSLVSWRNGRAGMGRSDAHSQWNESTIASRGQGGNISQIFIPQVSVRFSVNLMQFLGANESGEMQQMYEEKLREDEHWKTVMYSK